jgi:hypothetical protein
VAVIKLAPIYAKLRGSVPLSILIPENAIESTRRRLRDDSGPDEEELPEGTEEFLASYMVVVQASMALLASPPFSSLAQKYQKLEDEYLSGGPPMSPIYDSYSSLHALAEIPIGIGSETPLTVLAQLTMNRAEYSSIHALVTEMAKSHLDLYRAIQVEGKTAEILHVRSRNRVTVHLTGPFLRPSDLFLGRVIRFHTGQHFIAESPYVLKTAEAEWLAYFARISSLSVNSEAHRNTSGKKKSNQSGKKPTPPSQDDSKIRLERHLRNGHSPQFWPEFITNAYDGERNGIVFLKGIPDQPATQPHHDLYNPSTFVPDMAETESQVPPLERLRRKLYAMAEDHGIPKRYEAFIRSTVIEGYVPPTKLPYAFLFRAFCCFGATTERGETLLYEYAHSDQCSADELLDIRALERGWFSLFEIRRVNLDHSLEVTDRLQRKRIIITEKAATREVGVSDVLAGWIMQYDDDTYRLEGGVLHVPSLLVPSVVEHATSTKNAIRLKVRSMDAKSVHSLLVPEVIIAVQRAVELNKEFLAQLRSQSGASSDSTRASPIELPPDVAASIANDLMARLRRTLDEPIPMFRQKTLRQLAHHPRSKNDAISWLREQERIFRANPQLNGIDLRPIWQELGLEYQGLDTDP